MDGHQQKSDKEVPKKEKNVFTFISLCGMMYVVKIGKYCEIWHKSGL